MKGSLRPAPVRPLVGRVHELETLRDAWREGGAAWIVQGPAGIGKSRLVRELASWAVSMGGVVVEGRATTATATPLRPVSEALIRSARLGLRPSSALDPYVPVLGSLVPDWHDGRDSTGTSGSTLFLGEALLRLAVEWAGGRTTMIVIEDLHWADPETIEVVDHVIHHIAQQPVLLVATLRDDDPSPGSRFAREAVAGRAAATLALRPMSTSEVIELATACVPDGELPPEVGSTLAARSEGVPFLVEELVASASSSGWDSLADAVPGSVVASIDRRLEQLGPSGRRLLIAAALLGRQFDWALAARTVGLPDESAARLLREAVGARLLDVDTASFRFRHAMTRDAVLRAAAPAEQAVLARRCLFAVEDAGVDSSLVLLAADLAQRSGDRTRAAEHLATAARHALDIGALRSAAQFAERARDAAGTGDTVDLDELLLEIAVAAGDVARARALGRELVRNPADDRRQAGRHLLIARAELEAGQWDAARVAADAAADLVPDDEARLAQVDALVAEAAMGQDDVAVAVARARRARVRASSSQQPAVECAALEVLGRAERGRDVRDAERVFRRAYDIAESAGLEAWRVRALHELGTIDLFDTLRLDRLQGARREALRLGAFGTVAMVDLQLAATHLERGEVTQALETARACQETSARLGLSTHAMSHMIEGMALARLGDEAGMHVALERGRAVDEDADYVEASIWGNAVPVLHLVRGDVAAAARALDRAMEVIRRRPAAALPYPGLWALTRTVLDDGGDAARAEVTALEFDTPASRRTLAVAEAVALGRHGDPAAAARFAAADEALGAGRSSFRQQLARLLVAPVAAAGGWGEPDAWLRGALAAFESMGLGTLAGQARRGLREIGAPVPRRSAVGAADVPEALARLGVTGREIDVLVLVADGATNREIAERLVISPRTVDKHVERLLQKTSTPRSGLRDIARRAGLITDDPPVGSLRT